MKDIKTAELDLLNKNKTDVKLGSDGDYESDYAVLDEDFEGIANQVASQFQPSVEEVKGVEEMARQRFPAGKLNENDFIRGQRSGFIAGYTAPRPVEQKGTKLLKNITDDEINDLWKELVFNQQYSLERRRAVIEKYLGNRQFEDPEDQFTFLEALRLINCLRGKGYDCEMCRLHQDLSEDSSQREETK